MPGQEQPLNNQRLKPSKVLEAVLGVCGRRCALSLGGQLWQQGGKQHKEVSPVLSDNTEGLCGKLMAGGSFCMLHNRLRMVMTSVRCQHGLVRPLAQDVEIFMGKEWVSAMLHQVSGGHVGTRFCCWCLTHCGWVLTCSELV